MRVANEERGGRGREADNARIEESRGDSDFRQRIRPVRRISVERTSVVVVVVVTPGVTETTNRREGTKGVHRARETRIAL